MRSERKRLSERQEAREKEKRKSWNNTKGEETKTYQKTNVRMEHEGKARGSKKGMIVYDKGK